MFPTFARAVATHGADFANGALETNHHLNQTKNLT